MSIHFKCVCSAVLNVPDEQAGAYGDCPSCGKVLQAPESAVTFEPIVMADAPAPEAAVAFEPAGPATAVAEEPPAAVPVPAWPEPEPAVAEEPPVLEPAVPDFESQLLAMAGGDQGQGAVVASDEDTVAADALPAMEMPPAGQPVPVADPEYMQAQVAADDMAAEVPVIEPDTVPAVVEEDDMYEARTLVDPIPNLAELEAIRALPPEPTPAKAPQSAATGRARTTTRRGKAGARTPARGKRDRRRPLEVLASDEEQYVEVKKKGGFFKKLIILLLLLIVVVVGALVMHIYDVFPIKQLDEIPAIKPYMQKLRKILDRELIDEDATEEEAGNATEDSGTEAGAGEDTKKEDTGTGAAKDTKQKEQKDDQAPVENPGNQ